MKIILAFALITLFSASVKAQVGMPQALSCTETAFNFSVSLGTKWKFSTPKMGPVEIPGNAPDYLLARSLKVDKLVPGPDVSRFSKKPSAIGGLAFATIEPNQLFAPHSSWYIEKAGYALPAVSSDRTANYIFVNPPIE